MPVLYNYWWFITFFESILVNKDTCMFYVANVITLRVVLELLWKFTLLVRYKLNIFYPPRLNQFDNLALLFGGCSRFVPLDKLVFYGYWKALTSGSLSMLYTALTLFLLCNWLCCSLSNYYLNNYNRILCYVCFYYCLNKWNYIIFLDPNYWRKHLIDLSCDVSL